MHCLSSHCHTLLSSLLTRASPTSSRTVAANRNEFSVYLEQRPANSSPRARSHPPPVWQIRFCRNTATLIDFCLICGCFRTTVAQLSGCDRDYMAHSIKYLLSAKRKSLSITSLVHKPRIDFISYLIIKGNVC